MTIRHSPACDSWGQVPRRTTVNVWGRCPAIGDFGGTNMATEQQDRYHRVASVEEAKESTPRSVRIGDRTLGLFYHEGSFFATDYRCPHMGFPLTDGTVEDGLLTCPWHHARFELSCGDTLDPFADDVKTYPVEVRDGAVYVDPDPERDASPETHWRDRLDHGLRENISLVIAKSVIGLDDVGVDENVPFRQGVEFGTQYRAAGWGRGLTTLAVMTNLLPDLRDADRPRALYVGLGEVAGESAGEPPFFAQEPLEATDVGAARLEDWFRHNIEVRDPNGGERVLRAAIRADLDRSTIAGMVLGAATDHLYLDTGHRLDFINKAFEAIDRLGWDRADEVLPTLVSGLAGASRAEESSSWRRPIDLAELLFETYEQLPAQIEAGAERSWSEPDDFVESLLVDDPHEIVNALTDAIEAGADATDLAGSVGAAAARRVAQFGTSNEFNDWNTVHHTYTYANAVHGMSERTESWVRYRGIFDAAMNVYLDRFLNMPPAAIPDVDGASDPDAALEEFEETCSIESDDTVDRAGRCVARYLDGGGEPATLKSCIGEVLLREDVGFHTRQNVEAAFAQFDRTGDPDRGRIHLIATARYLAAHTPTRRSGEQTYRIAERLHRGEKIHESEE